jgi:hypothetical protein
MLGLLLREDAEKCTKGEDDSSEEKVNSALTTALATDNEGVKEEGNNKGRNP